MINWNIVNKSTKNSKITKNSSSSFLNTKKTTLCLIFQYGYQYGCQVHIHRLSWLHFPIHEHSKASSIDPSLSWPISSCIATTFLVENFPLILLLLSRRIYHVCQSLWCKIPVSLTPSFTTFCIYLLPGCIVAHPLYSYFH